MKLLINFTKKILRNGGLFLIISIITYNMVFSKINFAELYGLLQNMNRVYIIMGIFSAIVMVTLEGYSIKRNLQLLGENKDYSKCLTYAFSGNFFSAITPAATGGQPMQLYFMCKDNIPASKGTLALMMELGAYQIAIVSMAVIGYIGFFEVINRSIGSFLPILLVGLALNIALLLITFTAIFSKKFIYTLVVITAKLISIFSHDKSVKFKWKALNGIEQYKMSAEILKKNKRAYTVNCLITLLRIIFMYSAPFWIYSSLGLTSVSFFQIIALQSVLYISCAIFPLPGGVGIWESGFLLYFKEVFTTSVMGSAMMLTRSVGFYFVVLLSGIFIAIVSILLQSKQFRRKECKGYVPQSYGN